MPQLNYKTLIKNISGNRVTRQAALKGLESALYKNLVTNTEPKLKKINQRKYEWIKALLANVNYNMTKGRISKHSFNRLVDVIADGAFHIDQSSYQETISKYKEKYGVEPPTFLVVSPTQKCNLNCTGCYAGSNVESKPTLPYTYLDKLLQEFHDEADGRFVVVSGGEPLMYKSEGHNILDIFEKYSDTFFMFYTNGTLITKKVAERLERLGNATPSISVEGFQEHTDARRGKGTFDKILQGMANLREAGVTFCVSATATEENAHVLLDDRFYDFFFEEQGASYMWQFQLMPIGRGNEIFNLMPSPETRVKLLRKWEYLLSEKKYSVVDFWNSGVITHGCIAYGRNEGYAYIDWNGNIMPCVFVPYWEDNIIDLYDNGKKFADALKSGLFRRGRQWQHDYNPVANEVPKNLLMPCSIKDHYANFRKNILTENSKGEDQVSEDVLHDENYYKKLVEYDRRLHELTDPIWEKEYLSELKLKQEKQSAK